MSKNLRSFIFLIAAFIVVSCGSSPPNNNYDWCYIFDFTDSDYDAVVTTGTYVDGVGFQSSAGVLNVKYTHTSIVEPAQVVANFAFVHPSGDSDFSATANIFGIIGTVSDTIPSFITTQEVVLSSQSSGVYSAFAEINLTSEAQTTIVNLQIKGFGANPFPTNGCTQNPTATRTAQVFPTLTPSNTPTHTPTYTNTPTNTPTPTDTPIGDWSCNVNFSSGSHSWTIVSGTQQSSYVEGILNNGLETGVWDAEVTITGGTSTTLTSVQIVAQFSSDRVSPPTLTEVGFWATNYSGSWGSAVTSWEVITPHNTPHTYSQYSMNVSANAFRIRLIQRSTGAKNQLRSIVLGGTGVKPFAWCNDTITATPNATETAENDATSTQNARATFTQQAIQTSTQQSNNQTATAAASITPTTTLTPTYSDRCNVLNYTFDITDYAWTGTGSWATGAYILANSAYVEQSSVALTPGEYYLTLVASVNIAGMSTSDGSVGFTYLITEPSAGTIGDTISPKAESYIFDNSNNVSYIVAVTIDETGAHTVKVTANLTDVTSIKLLSVCLSDVSPDEIPDDNENNNDDGSGGWQTCGDQISQPSSIIEVGGWITYLWESADQTVQCKILPPVIAIKDYTLAAIAWITNTGQNFFEWTVGQVVPFIIGSLNNFFNALWALLTQGISSIGGQLQQIVVTVTTTIEEIVGYVETGMNYIDAAQSQMVTIVGTYRATPSTAPAGLPDCIVNPTAYEMCAVFWILENTFFSGFFGSLLIPAITLFIDMLIVFYFGNIAKRFLMGLWELLDS